MSTDKYYRAFKDIRGNRDVVFETVLDYFENKPIEILEIGCARNLDVGSRQSDGWSTCFWADYISQNKGTLSIYDISDESTSNCRKIINHWWKNINCKIFTTAYGGDYKNFDLIFLDGGDDPRETLNQFEKTEDSGAEIILIDDFHSKGRLLPQPDTIWKWENGHQLAAFGIKLGEVNLENIET